MLARPWPTRPGHPGRLRAGHRPAARAWNNRAYRHGLVPASGYPFPLSAEPETEPDLGSGADGEPEADMFPDFLPPGWSSGGDDRSFP
jgi:hypothetical protein